MTFGESLRIQRSVSSPRSFRGENMGISLAENSPLQTAIQASIQAPVVGRTKPLQRKGVAPISQPKQVRMGPLHRQSHGMSRHRQGHRDQSIRAPGGRHLQSLPPRRQIPQSRAVGPVQRPPKVFVQIVKQAKTPTPHSPLPLPGPHQHILHILICLSANENAFPHFPCSSVAIPRRQYAHLMPHAHPLGSQSAPAVRTGVVRRVKMRA